MTREEAIELLPCYVSGDLPADQTAALEDLVVRDEEVRRLAERLRVQHERAVAALCARAVPDELTRQWRGEVEDTEEVPTAQAVSSRTPFLLTVLAVAAAALIALGLTWTLGPGMPHVASIPSVVYAHRTVMAGQLPSVDPADPEALSRAWDAADLPPGLRSVADLSHLGLTITAVHLVPGQPPGAATRYRDASGQEILCQRWLGLTVPERASVVRDVDGLRLHGFQADEVALVMWQEGEVLGVMSGEMPLERLTDLVARRVGSG